MHASWIAAASALENEARGLHQFESGDNCTLQGSDVYLFVRQGFDCGEDRGTCVDSSLGGDVSFSDQVGPLLLNDGNILLGAVHNLLLGTSSGELGLTGDWRLAMSATWWR